MERFDQLQIIKPDFYGKVIRIFVQNYTNVEILFTVQINTYY